MEALSGGRVSPPVGSLYRVLDKLLSEQFIEEHSSDVVDGRFRRYYQLTPAGREELTRSADAMTAVVAQARRRLRRTAPATPSVSGVRA